MEARENMARNVIRRGGAPAGGEDVGEDDLDEAQRAPEAGGTPGIRGEVTSGAQLNPETVVTRPEDKVVRDARDPASEAAPQPRTYEVLSATNVMYNNFRYHLPAGKILSEHMFDIPALKRQGVRMQEVRLEG